MKTSIKLFPLVLVSTCFFPGCEKENDYDPEITGGFIASYQVAKEDILRCLQYFEENLEGFNASKAVYNFAYNESNTGLEQFALTKVRAVRTQGDTALNPIPVNSNPGRLGCWSYGPDNAYKWVEKQVNEFIAGKGGWLVLNLHGLDDEGWGPVSSQYLSELLKRIIKVEYLDILPAGVVLEKTLV